MELYYSEPLDGEMAVEAIFLSWAFPPMNFPRAVQVARLADYWGLGSLDVVCAGPTGKSTYRNISDTSDVTVNKYQDRFGPLFLKMAARIISDDFRQRPDMQVFWAKFIEKKILTIIKGKDNPVLVSFGQPMSDHLAALNIKNKTNIPWVAHFSDPWADNPFSNRSPANQKRIETWEKRVVEEADALVFTSEETVDLVMNKYPDEFRQKASVIPHAFRENRPRKEVEINTGNRTLKIRYLGNLYGERNPIQLIKALMAINDEIPELLNKIKFEFFGELDNATNNTLSSLSYNENFISINKGIDYDESLRLMASADVLLILDAPAEKSVFLPSKLIDYIGSGRPLLGITPPGTAANIIQKLGFPVCNSLDALQMKDPLISILKKIQQGDYRLSYNADRYQPEKVTREMEEIVIKVANKK